MKRPHAQGPVRRLEQGWRALAEGRLDAAETICRDALDARPDDPDALHLLAAVARDCEQAEAAAALLLRAVEVAPRRADLSLALGEALTAAGRTAEAVNAFRASVELDPRVVSAHFRLGETRHVLGDLEGALASYRQAAALDPDSAEIQNNLGSVLGELGRLGEAGTAFEKARELSPGLPHVHANLGCVLSKRGEHEAAVASLRQAVTFAPDFARGHMNLGTALKEAGRPEEAVLAYRRGTRLAPDDHEVHSLLGRLHLERGDTAAALVVCDEFLARHPSHAGLLALKALALNAAGDRAACNALVDFARFVRVIRIQAPPGYADVPAFNAALANHVENHPSLTFAPATHATQQGYHSGSLLAPPLGPIEDLERIIEQAILDYGHALPRDASHPFLAHPPEAMKLDVWGVVMPALGHQIPHVHPSGWLSGCYYVKIPPVVRTTASHEGWLEFGRPDDKRLAAIAPDVHRVQPEEGMLVLFPSYFYHHTIPFQADARRISIAFDALPDEP